MVYMGDVCYIVAKSNPSSTGYHHYKENIKVGGMVRPKLISQKNI